MPFDRRIAVVDDAHVVEHRMGTAADAGADIAVAEQVHPVAPVGDVVINQQLDDDLTRGVIAVGDILPAVGIAAAPGDAGRWLSSVQAATDRTPSRSPLSRSTLS